MDRRFLGILIVLPVFAMLIFAVPGKVLAAEEEGILKLDDFGLDEVEESLKELSGSEIQESHIMQIIAGEGEGVSAS